MAELLLEEVGKRLASVGRSSRRGLALNYRSWRKQLARVVCVLVHDAFCDLRAAFEVSAGIKMSALPATVERAVALGARTGEVDRGWSRNSAVRTLHCFPKRHHLW